VDGECKCNVGDLGFQLPDTFVVSSSGAGSYGSARDDGTYVGLDCNAQEAVKLTTPQPFGGGGGWAGWSCVEESYPLVLSGGASKEPVAQGPAKAGVTVGGYTYPVYPHYTYPPPQEGWVVQGSAPCDIFVICGHNP